MVHDCGKNKCTTYIKERMLFDKHRCQNDADRQNQCQETDQLVFAQLFIVCHRKINAERIIYMVRILTGTLIEVGRGERAPESMPALLKAKERKQAGYTAPPQGLRLEKVTYETMDGRC